jgi:hypothetical protein
MGANSAIRMKYHKQICTAMTILGGILLIALTEFHTESNASTQTSNNDVSSSATVCMDNQQCYSMTCDNGQPCQIEKSPSNGSPLEDKLDDIGDTLDDVEDEFD